MLATGAPWWGKRELVKEGGERRPSRCSGMSGLTQQTISTACQAYPIPIYSLCKWGIASPKPFQAFANSRPLQISPHATSLLPIIIKIGEGIALKGALTCDIRYLCIHCTGNGRGVMGLEPQRMGMEKLFFCSHSHYQN